MRAIRALTVALTRTVSAVNVFETVVSSRLSCATIQRKVARILFGAAMGEPRAGLSISEMAMMAGTTWQSVASALQALQADGLVRVERHRIMIPDGEALRSLAGCERSTQ